MGIECIVHECEHVCVYPRAMLVRNFSQCLNTGKQMQYTALLNPIVVELTRCSNLWRIQSHGEGSHGTLNILTSSADQFQFEQQILSRAKQAAINYTPNQKLRALLEMHQLDEFLEELGRVELTGKIAEFQAISLHGILAVIRRDEDSALAYLEMAAAAASTSDELAIVSEITALHDLLHRNTLAAARRCLLALDQVCHTEGLWITLLIALSRLGKVETIDAIFQALTRLNEEGTAQLVRIVSSEPALAQVSVRPTFKKLADRLPRG